MAPTDLEPQADHDIYWSPVDLAHDTGLVCVECRSNTKTERMYTFKENSRNCINCSANDQCQYGVAHDQGQYTHVAPELTEQQALMILATRIKCALEASGMALIRIDEVFKSWLVNVAAAFVANMSLAYGEKLMKAVSHMGGVRIPSHQVREIFKNNRGKPIPCDVC